MQVLPELSVSLHVVVEASPSDDVIGSSDLKVGPAIAHTVISLRTVEIVRDGDGSEELSIPEQYSRLRLNAQSLHSPRHRTVRPGGGTLDVTDSIVYIHHIFRKDHR